MPRTCTLTYDIVTPESAEEGDYADCGFGTGRDDGTTTSTRDFPAPLGDAQAAWNAARERATATIEPDEYDGDESAAAVALVVKLIRDEYGATEPSCAPRWADGTWYTAPDGDTDYRTGAVTRVSVHLDGWTDDEQRAIYQAVTRRRW